MYQCYYESPVGLLLLTCTEDHLLSITYVESREMEDNNQPILQETIQQLDEYFFGKRITFSVPLKVEGTPFQQSVWETLKNIPYGTTLSYLDVGKAISNVKAVRAIGQANKANKFPIIIPCHRVIGSNKKLKGYNGNQIDKQAFLLQLEQKKQANLL